MNSTAIATMVKMMERLPATTQERVVEHMREYLADLEDEALWDEQFAHSQSKLAAAAQKAWQEVETGKRSQWILNGCEIAHVAVVLGCL